jgi:HEAT repeat protein
MTAFRASFAALCLFLLVAPAHSQAIPQEIGGKTYEQWKTDLTNLDAKVRAEALTILPQFREKALDAVPIVVDRTRDADAPVRIRAVFALKRMGIRGADRESVVKALGQRVSHDTHSAVRYEAARALPRFGADVRDVAGDLIQGMAEVDSWELREACIQALITAGTDDKYGPPSRVTDELLRRLDPQVEKASRVRLQAVIALGVLGPPRDPKKLSKAIDALHSPAIMDDSSKVIRIWSRASLMSLRNKANDKDLKLIVGYLKDEDRNIRVQAVSALGMLQSKADKYVPDMLRLLQTEEDPAVLLVACGALAAMGKLSISTNHALIMRTMRENAESISIALSAYIRGGVGVPSEQAMDALAKDIRREKLNEEIKTIARDIVRDLQKPKADDDRPRRKSRNR